MKRCIKASQLKLERGGIRTKYFTIQVEPANELIRTIDINGNYVEMYPYEVEELVDGLQQVLKIFS